MDACKTSSYFKYHTLTHSLLYISSYSGVTLKHLNWKDKKDKWCKEMRTIDRINNNISIASCKNNFFSAFEQIGNEGREVTLYPTEWKNWHDYSTVFVDNDKNCTWPKPPGLHQNLTLKGYEENIRTRNATAKEISTAPLAVMGGFVNNYWHASLMLNKMCEMKDAHVSFLVQSGPEPTIPVYFYRLSSEMGIQPARILHHVGPVTTTSPVLGLNYFYGSINWECLFQHVGRKEKLPQLGYILLITRPTIITNGVIRSSRSNGRHFERKVSELASALTSNTGRVVITFNGSESFEIARSMFAGASLVIGPHGAAMVNLIFCHRRTPVIEFHQSNWGFRPWLMHGAATVGLDWWPVVMQDYESVEVLKLVDIAKEALTNISPIGEV